MTALVVGLGHADRGDDGVGVVVARRVAELDLPDVVVVDHHDPTALIDLWAGHAPVVVVDAVRSGAPPGRVHRLVVGTNEPALPAASWEASGRGSTHGFGLAAAVALARALHRLPERLVVIGVEAASYRHGEPLSAAVAEAVPEAVELVREEVRNGVPG
ncbi:hydrogenase maturation protease [Nocardioides sp.]|uniref:hydrogenase maturation protease n=1 Tax=Nocardioides sp. TaxID=35761 RepID=UPI002EDA926D